MGQISARQPGGKVPENLALPRKALVKKLTNLRELNSSFFSSKDPCHFEVWLYLAVLIARLVAMYSRPAEKA